MCEPHLEPGVGERVGRMSLGLLGGGVLECWSAGVLAALTQALSSIKLNFALTEAHCKLTNASSGGDGGGKDWQGSLAHFA